MEDPSSLLVDSNSPWQIPYSPLISEEPIMLSNQFKTLDGSSILELTNLPYDHLT